MEVIDYKQQAQNIANRIGLKMTVEFLKHDFHFEGDKDKRDIYKITLTKGSRNYTFNFGQSINCSGEYIVAPHLRNKLWCEQNTGGKYALTQKEYAKMKHFGWRDEVYKNPNFAAPIMYNVLCCLQKYEVGTFENFCDDFGYDIDSKKAEKIYNAVLEEWRNVQVLFSDEEIEQLQQIQ